MRSGQRAGNAGWGQPANSDKFNMPFREISRNNEKFIFPDQGAGTLYFIRGKKFLKVVNW